MLHRNQRNAKVRSGPFASIGRVATMSGLARTADLPDAIAIFAFGPEGDIRTSSRSPQQWRAAAKIILLVLVEQPEPTISADIAAQRALSR